jgi:excinuclease ABC subunit C
MELRFSLPFDPNSDGESFFDSLPSQPAVFALFPCPTASPAPPPYLSRSRDLRRRLARLLSRRSASSRMLNLRELTCRIEYQGVGSSFEAQWLLYLLNKLYYPKHYRERLRLKPPALLKLNLRNRFPRCYPTRRLSSDGSLYYGPFPSQVAAERFAAEFLDFFKIRRCTEDLDPHLSHPGCIYSQMHMCLAPCFVGCADTEYEEEVRRVVEFLDAEGRPLLRSLEAERAHTSETMEFEQAAKVHRTLEKVHEVLRHKPDLVRNLRDLHALIVQRAAEAKSVVFFRACAGELRGPATLSLDENVPAPVPLDEQLHNLLKSLASAPPGSAFSQAPPASSTDGEARLHGVCLPPESRQPPRVESGEEQSSATAGRLTSRAEARRPLPPWEHLSLLARWYYSSFREGELVMLNRDQAIPHTRLIRICRKLLAAEASRPVDLARL